MKIAVGCSNGVFNILNIKNNNYDIRKENSDYKNLCGLIKPIIKIKDDFLLIGINGVFFNIYSLKKEKNYSVIKCPEIFYELCLFKTIKTLVFATSINFIFVWEINSFKNCNIIHKIISKEKTELISKISKSNLLITSYKQSNNINIWNIFENNIYFCGKANILEKVLGIEGSSCGQYFSIQTIKGHILTYNNRGYHVSTMLESKTNKSNSVNFIHNSLKFYDKNTFLTGGNSKNLSLWDLRVNKIVKQWKGHVHEIMKIDVEKSVLYSNNSLVVSYDTSSTIKIWDTRIDNELNSFKIFSGKISSVKII
jgi:WD40 repeat protein